MIVVSAGSARILSVARSMAAAAHPRVLAEVQVVRSADDVANALGD